ncbi:unnamed protein product [Mycena citricolor]|uniref:Signal peptidase subunit 3 n=1 Tax=Mycena citricolor TaxID=2018698 RepID=A0AAD2K241_9AGAR|nr:unnamed protein product [Mycena citricolor]
MHTIITRANNISAFLSSCAMALLGIITVTSMLGTYFQPPLQGGAVTVKGLKVMHGRGKHYQTQHAVVNFEIDSDLSPLFNWNTKQLFLYLEAEYKNSKGVQNSVVIWDKIVRRKEDANIKIEGRQKYPFKDLVGFKDAAATYTLRYNVMPHVGTLVWGSAGSTNGSVPFPAMSSA